MDKLEKLKLLDLPAEVLLKILDFVGPEYFQWSLSRLTIAKKWYDSAIEILYRYIDLNFRRMLRLARNKVALGHVKTKMRSISLTLNDYVALHMIDTDMGLVRPLEGAFFKIALAMRDSSSLRHLEVKANDSNPFDRLNFTPYLGPQALPFLILAPTLTSLDIDITDHFPNFQNPTGLIRPDKYHVCVAVNTILPTLRHLRYRTPSLCPALLSMERYEELPRLEEVIINVFRQGYSSYELPMEHNSMKCRHVLGESAPQDWPKSLERLGAECVRRMPNARVFKIASWCNKRQEARVYDALEDKAFRTRVTRFDTDDSDESDESDDGDMWQELMGKIDLDSTDLEEWDTDSSEDDGEQDGEDDGEDDGDDDD